MCVCVCARERERDRERERESVCVCVSERERECVCVCVCGRAGVRAFVRAYVRDCVCVCIQPIFVHWLGCPIPTSRRSRSHAMNYGSSSMWLYVHRDRTDY